MDVKDLADKVIADFENLKVAIGDFKGSWVEVVKNIPKAIIAVEKIGKDYILSGSDKKALAILVLDLIVKIKWMPGFIKIAIIEIVIEGVIAAYNMFGHEWLMKL